MDKNIQRAPKANSMEGISPTRWENPSSRVQLVPWKYTHMIVTIEQKYRITFDIENRNILDVYKKDGW